MGVFSEIFRSVVGKIHFMVYLGKTPAAEIEVKDKEIIVNIVHPIIALELGVEEMLSNKGKRDINTLEKIKKAGYKIKIKYKMFEIEM